MESDFLHSNLFLPVLMLCSISLTLKVDNNNIYLIGLFKELRVKIYKALRTALAHCKYTWMLMNGVFILSFFDPFTAMSTNVCKSVHTFFLNILGHYKLYLLIPPLFMKTTF